IPPVPTSSIDIGANLDAAAATGTTFTFPLQVIDSLGGGHQFQLKATKDATAGKWNLTLSSDDPTVQGGADLTSKLSLTSLTFVNGALDPATDPAVTISGLTYTSTSGVPDQGDIKWNLWKTVPAGTPPTGGVSGLTQFSQASTISNLTQNGSPVGTLASVSIATGGLLMGTYTNGLQKEVGQLALSVIQNPDSLLGLGNNTFRGTANSNILPPSAPSAGGGGQIIGQSLEGSNVDIAQEFTDLITFQRSYQASSKVITTIDQLTMDTLNLKT
ncbi:MAG: flagellar hook-basal body complex protein, partial [Acidobacteriota bacterium]